MAKILCLAASGFGKTSGIGDIAELNFKGLNPESSYIISKTSKPLPWKGSGKKWPLTTRDSLKDGRRVIADNSKEAVEIMEQLIAAPPIKNVVFDDFNYYMQDWYMDNALRTGWDAPKQIGYDMGKLFKIMEKFEGEGKNLIVLAHGEDVPKPGGRIYTKLKTTGKMVDEYVTPEGKFDVVLVGSSKWDSAGKKILKQYVTNENEDYASPKSPVGMFPELYISNDLGGVVEAVNKYYLGE